MPSFLQEPGTITMRIPALLAAASVVTHALFFVGAAFLLADLLVLPVVFAGEIEGDWLRLWPYAAATLAGWWPLFAVGLVAAGLGGWLLWTSSFGDAWFRRLMRAAGWLWLPLVPLGPAIGTGLLVLSSKRDPGKERPRRRGLP